MPVVKQSIHAVMRIWDRVVLVLLIFCAISGTVWYCLRYTEPEEAAARQKVIETAQGYLGCREADGTHQRIIDLYNSHEPKAREYTVTYEDNWCATFTSAVSIACAMTDYIPTECSCEQQIRLFQQLGCWEEQDWYLPKAGDLIYYVWDEWRPGNCTAWAQHVGIVVQTYGPVIQVIEGNKDNMVTYRYLYLNDIHIRGYGKPDYRSFANKQQKQPMDHGLF